MQDQVDEVLDEVVQEQGEARDGLQRGVTEATSTLLRFRFYTFFFLTKMISVHTSVLAPYQKEAPSILPRLKTQVVM